MVINKNYIYSIIPQFFAAANNKLKLPMNIDQLLLQSLQLLGLGMGSVFIILILLIGIIQVISKLVPEAELPPASAPALTPVEANTQHIAAIQAAIHRYRKTHSTSS